MPSIWSLHAPTWRMIPCELLLLRYSNMYVCVCKVKFIVHVFPHFSGNTYPINWALARWSPWFFILRLVLKCLHSFIPWILTTFVLQYSSWLSNKTSISLREGVKQKMACICLLFTEIKFAYSCGKRTVYWIS